MKRLRRYLVAGLLIWAPLAVTFLLLRIAVNLMDKTLAIIPQQYRPEELLGFNIPGLGVILTFVVLFITGMLAANFVGRYVVGGWESLLDRIPIVRTIYGGAKNFAEIVFRIPDIIGSRRGAVADRRGRGLLLCTDHAQPNLWLCHHVAAGRCPGAGYGDRRGIEDDYFARRCRPQLAEWPNRGVAVPATWFRRRLGPRPCGFP
jgi:hypothetical protein